MITFFDLLGIDRSATAEAQLAAAAAKWPQEEVQPFTGDAFTEGDPAEAYREFMDYLRGCLEFKAVRSSASGGTVGLSAELHVSPAALPLPQPLVLAKMPDVAYLLRPTEGVPAQLHVTRTGDAVELVILGLPVEIQLPPGFVTPQRLKNMSEAVVDLPEFETTNSPFNAADPDSLRIVLRDLDSSSIFTRIDVRMTPEFDFVVDTRVPITIGPCVFLGLACEALHDLQLVPSPRLQHTHDVPVEWARHDLDFLQLSSAMPGLFTFRAIDLDRSAEPVAELLKRMSTTRPPPAGSSDPAEVNEIEPVIEDVAFPTFSGPLPIPAHLRFGLRKVVFDLKAPFGEEYDLAGAPIDIPIFGWHLKIFRVLVQSSDDDQAVGGFEANFEAVLVAGDDPATSWSFGLDYNDEGVLIATGIIPIDQRPRLFTILNREVRLIGVKLGYSLFDPEETPTTPAPVIPLGDMGWADRLVLLLDFEIKNIDTKNVFSVSAKAGTAVDQPSIFHDLGWYLGRISLGGFYDPDGVEIKAFDRFRIEIEEIAVVSATNGATYLMVSAGIDFRIGAAPAGRPNAKEQLNGIHFHRLKFRMGDQNDRAANVLLDGISLRLSVGEVELEGFGMLSEHFVEATKIEEFGFALHAKFELLKKVFELGVGFFYGKASGEQNFSYWMFNLNLGETSIPVGSAEISHLRLLVAGNMRPRLPPPDGNAAPLRLFRWYKADGDALSVPLNRQLAAWERFDDSFAFGAGARLTLAGTKAVSFDLFFFVRKSPDDAGLFVALEIYLAKSTRPVGYGVLEIDFKRGSWAAEIGVCLTIKNILGKPQLPDELTSLASLTGSIFFAKNIDTLAIGQFSDPATWLTARLQWTTGWQADIWAALCIHHVDDPDGPHVAALSVGAKGALDIGIGTLKLYATVTIVWGRWRNEAVATGVLARAEAGIRIRVFRFINFGAVIEIEIDWLGPPRCSRQSFTFKIETPWWLPDVSVRWENVKGTPQLDRMDVVSCPLIAAAALSPATRAPTLIGVTPLTGSSLDEKAVFHLDQLRAMSPPAVADAAFAAVEPVGVDARIALDFKPSVDAPVTVVPDTPVDAGVQESGETSVRYELIEVGIRRRKRFGPDAGVWADLFTPESTHITSIADLTALFTPDVRFEWDVDVIREGRTDTRRLLVNADTAFSLTTSSPEADDVAAETFPGWPCCVPPRRPRRGHQIDFDAFAFGVRAPASQRFTDSRSTFTWQSGLPPVVGPAIHAPAGSVPVFVHLTARPPGPIAVASFDERVAVCEIFVHWTPLHSKNVFVIEAFDGLALVASEKLHVSVASPPVIRLNTPGGVTSLLIRKLGTAGQSAPVGAADGDIELVRVRYRTVREELQVVIAEEKCRAGEDRVHGSGTLAWLPNRDYEITLRVRVTLEHERSGAQDATVEQKAFFRTKGLVGLNAVARVGDEVEPYVESRYPGPGGERLYRHESLAVAFTERFNILAPVNRTPSTTEEANQILEWVLAVEKVGGPASFERLSQTSPDWIVAHRNLSPPLPPRRPALLTAAVFTTGERSAPTIDPLVVRYESMMDRPGGCSDPGDGLHPSQVLIHAPVDPGAPDGDTPRWEADEELRVNLRQKLAPFVDRAAFDPADASAFTRLAASGAPAVWRSDDGAMRVDADPQPAPAQYAVFGDSDWRHVQIETTVDPAGGEAGVAVAVSGARSVEALLSAAGVLRLIERDGSTLRPLAESVTVPIGESAAQLEVIAYDDRVRATIGEQKIEGPFGHIREGRLALVSRGGGRFTRLHVGGLDAWRFHCRTSRYDDFTSHIQSWNGVFGVLHPGDVASASLTVAVLLGQTASDIPLVMVSGGDAEKRQRLFEAWTTALGLPLRERPRDLALTRWVENDTTSLFLLESDEPLPFSRDVTVTLAKRIKVPTFPHPTHPPVVATVAAIPDLEFDDTRIVAPALPARARAGRRILRVVAVERGRVEVEAFEIDRSRRESLLADRVAAAAEWPRELSVPRPGDLVVVDDRNVPVLPIIPPFGHFIWSPIAAMVLTNDDETRALIVPSGGPLMTGNFRLQFRIDRPRWRAAAPDATSNYEQVATLPFTLP